MSIIYDALKKTQQDNPFPAQAASNRPQEQSPGKNKPFAQRARSAAVAVAVIAAIAAGIWYFTPARILLQPGKPGKKKYSKQNMIATVKPQPSIVIPLPSGANNAVSSQKEFPKLSLQGILLSDEGNSALINEQVCTVGDDVEGAIIEEINSGHVVLSYKSQRFILRNK